MKAHWWSCVLGLFCMPAVVTLNTWPVTSPISITRVNSSSEITCSTSLPDPLGVYLHRHFQGQRDAMFLSLEHGQVTKETIAAEFAGRIHLTPSQQTQRGYWFTWQLSSLRLEDTDLYYCEWTFFRLQAAKTESLVSNHTVIIVRERDPRDQCGHQGLDIILVVVNVMVLIVMLGGGVLIVSHRIKRRIRAEGAGNLSGLDGPLHVCPQQQVEHFPYIESTSDTRDTE
ncbi:uncharacterized protein ACBR49_017885 [Aulostomus maculatus]